MPGVPTAVPLFASVKETPSNQFVVPLDCEVQFIPLFVVLRIIPNPPTAVPLFASVKETPFNSHIVPLDCEVHVAPPFVVLMIVP